MANTFSVTKTTTYAVNKPEEEEPAPVYQWGFVNGQWVPILVNAAPPAPPPAPVITLPIVVANPPVFAPPAPPAPPQVVTLNGVGGYQVYNLAPAGQPVLAPAAVAPYWPLFLYKTLSLFNPAYKEGESKRTRRKLQADTPRDESDGRFPISLKLPFFPSPTCISMPSTSPSAKNQRKYYSQIKDPLDHDHSLEIMKLKTIALKLELSPLQESAYQFNNSAKSNSTPHAHTCANIHSDSPHLRNRINNMPHFSQPFLIQAEQC
ncbi:hypothetical protein RUND412_001708 [Rhizina undulata]